MADTIIDLTYGSVSPTGAAHRLGIAETGAIKNERIAQLEGKIALLNYQLKEAQDLLSDAQLDKKLIRENLTMAQQTIDSVLKDNREFRTQRDEARNERDQLQVENGRLNSRIGVLTADRNGLLVGFIGALVLVLVILLGVAFGFIGSQTTPAKPAIPAKLQTSTTAQQPVRQSVFYPAQSSQLVQQGDYTVNQGYSLVVQASGSCNLTIKTRGYAAASGQYGHLTLQYVTVVQYVVSGTQDNVESTKVHLQCTGWTWAVVVPDQQVVATQSDIIASAANQGIALPRQRGSGK